MICPKCHGPHSKIVDFRPDPERAETTRPHRCRVYLTYYRGRVPRPLFQTGGQRGKNRNGALETRSVLRIVRELRQKVGLRIWRHSLRHTSITQAAELGQRAASGSTRSARIVAIARSRH
jgi:hypothetical protein